MHLNVRAISQTFSSRWSKLEITLSLGCRDVSEVAGVQGFSFRIHGKGLGSLMWINPPPAPDNKFQAG